VIRGILPEATLVRLAWRSIWRNRRRTLITLSSMAFGLVLAIFMICFQEGTFGRMVDEAVRMQAGHVTVMHPRYLTAPSADLFVGNAGALRARIERLGGVERTKELVMGQGLAKSAVGASGIAVTGVEPSGELAESPLPRHILKGRYLSDGGRAEAVIGMELARRLGIGVGSKFVVAVNNINGELDEELCRVCGIFSMGSEEMDGYLIQVPIGFARRLYGLPPGSVTCLGVVLRNADDRFDVIGRISAMPEARGAAIYPWERVIPEVSGLIGIKRASARVLLFFLMFLVLFTVFNTLLMSVLERGREFGVMLALGTTAARLRAQVFLEVLFLNLLGCLAGLLLGSAIVLFLQSKGIDISKIYSSEVSISGFAFDKTLYPRLTGAVLGWVGGLAFSVTLVLGLIPVWRSAKIRVAEVLR